ncbi:hypothetical protein Hanom_Chr06g00522681 [Helianthus anomalus]
MEIQVFLYKKRFNPWWSGLSGEVVEKGKLTPPLADSQKRIDIIRLLPEIERSFNSLPSSPSQLSSLNMSDSSKVPILLDLDELDSYPTPVNVKK